MPSKPTSLGTLPRCVRCSVDRFWGGGLSRGGISYGIIVGNLTAVRYRDQVLRPFAVPLLKVISTDFTA